MVRAEVFLTDLRKSYIHSSFAERYPVISLNSIAILLNKISSRLATTSDTASLDSQVLLAFILGKPRAWVLAHPEAVLSPEQTHQLEIALARLENGEPLPYVLGHWEFYGLDFIITPDVLIPRPETELLVERSLEWLGAHPARRWIAEVGTGSGCIAISLAKQNPDLQVVTSDISLPALKVAQRNVIKHNVAERVHLVQSDLLRSIAPATDKRFDLICANLPYIPKKILKSLQVSRWEPNLALSGGEDGLDLFQRLLQQTPINLASGGCLFLEIEANMGDAIRSLSHDAFPQATVVVLQDLAGRDRLVQVELPLSNS